MAEQNKITIELNEAGMKYYINSIFASDFIHDFGGTSNARLKSLAKKVDKLLEMIGSDILSGGGALAQQQFAPEFASAQVDPQRRYEDSVYGPSVSRRNLTACPVEPYFDKSTEVTPLTPMIDAGLAGLAPPIPVATTEFAPPPLPVATTEFAPQALESVPQAPVSTTELAPQALVATELTEVVTPSPFANIDPRYIEYVYINSLLDENYGSYDILDPDVPVISDYDLEAARQVLELKKERPEVEVMADEAEKLAMLHKSLNYELNEYASEIILGITSYIGSELVPIDEPPTDIQSTDASTLGGSSHTKHGGAPPTRREDYKKTIDMDESLRRREDFASQIRKQKRGQYLNMYRSGAKTNQAQSLAFGRGDGAGAGTASSFSAPSPQVLADLDPNNPYESILSANSTLRVKIENSYDKEINEGLGNIFANLIPNPAAVQGMSDEEEVQGMSEEEVTEHLTNLLIDQYNIIVSKEVELKILDEISDEYIHSFLSYIRDTTEVSTKFWFSKPNTDNLDAEQIKQYFKLSAELNDIVNKYFSSSKTRSGRSYQPITNVNVLVNYLLYVIFNQVDTNAIKTEILNEYDIDSMKTSIETLCQAHMRGQELTADNIRNFTKNILSNGQWEQITLSNSNLFATQLLHSSYFNSIVKETILNKLRTNKLVLDYDNADVRRQMVSFVNFLNSKHSNIKEWQVRQWSNPEDPGDPLIGRTYYVNITTGNGQWDEPEPIATTLKREIKDTFSDLAATTLRSWSMHGGAPEEIKPNGCNNATIKCNQIKDVCASIGSLPYEDFKSQKESNKTQILTLHNQLIEDMFVLPIQDGTKEFFDTIENFIIFTYNKLTENKPRKSIEAIQDFSVKIANMYDALLNKQIYCGSFFSEQKKMKEQADKVRKQKETDKKRAAAGQVNVEWSNKLTEYVARASLIITESVDDNGFINQIELNRLREKIFSTPNPDPTKSRGNWLFYLSTLRILLHQADYLSHGENRRIIEGFLSRDGDVKLAGTTGVLDDKTIQSAEIILNNLFSGKKILDGSNLGKWKTKNTKTLINNALAKWPLTLSPSNSFCPISSINDGQPTCSTYAKERRSSNIEAADMNVYFEDDEGKTFYNLINKLESSPGRPQDFNICKIVVEAYLGNGFKDTVQGKGILVIGSNINLDIGIEDKTLDAAGVLRTVIKKMKGMWRSFSQNSGFTPKDISDKCWEAMLSKYNYYEFLTCSHLKALGDTTQELNGALKFGGYTSAGIRNYKQNNIYFNATPSGKINTPSIVNRSTNFQAGTIVPFSPEGDAPRGTLSNDRQAGARSIWLLTCLPDNVINREAIGGYASRAESILASASPIGSSGTGASTVSKGKKKGGSSLHHKKTRIIKKQKKRTRFLKKNNTFKSSNKKTRIIKKRNKKTKKY